MSRMLLLHPVPALLAEYFPDCERRALNADTPDITDKELTPVLFPKWRHGVCPDPRIARDLLARLADTPAETSIILISSTMVYGADYRNPIPLPESRALRPRRLGMIAASWLAYENLFHEAVGDRLLVLRIAPCPAIEEDSLFRHMQEARGMYERALFDPALQFLHPADLAGLLTRLRHTPARGVYNVASNESVSADYLRNAYGWKKFHPTPKLDPPHAFADYFRYPWSVDTDKARRELGFEPRHDAASALGLETAEACDIARSDLFGMDTAYIARQCRGIAGFLHDKYFRIDYQGEEMLDDARPGIVLGVHRGFMPFDGFMLLYYFHTQRNSLIRFFSHPTLLKLPLPFNFTKLGGIPASGDSARRVLEHDQWLGIFPEGIQGAFNYYRDTYRIGDANFGEYIRLAIRNQVPVYPMVTIGSAEIFPILAKLHWPWLEKLTLWPCLPIAPPFPLLPLPLPTKWTSVFLRPLATHEYDPKDAEDPELVARLARDARERMQLKLSELKAKRRSWWW